MHQHRLHSAVYRMGKIKRAKYLIIELYFNEIQLKIIQPLETIARKPIK